MTILLTIHCVVLVINLVIGGERGTMGWIDPLLWSPSERCCCRALDWIRSFRRLETDKSNFEYQIFIEQQQACGHLIFDESNHSWQYWLFIMYIAPNKGSDFYHCRQNLLVQKLKGIACLSFLIILIYTCIVPSIAAVNNITCPTNQM